MKKYLMLIALVFGVTATGLYAQTDKKDPKDEQREIKARFEKLGKDIDQKLAVAEDNLKKANAETKADMQKAVDKLKGEANDVKKASEKANKEIKEDWATVKKELSDAADKIERELKK